MSAEPELARTAIKQLQDAPRSAKPEQQAAVRQANILEAARWCFLNFGFSKISRDDIGKRARISRTLLYRIFKDKKDIFTAVFAHG